MILVIIIIALHTHWHLSKKAKMYCETHDVPQIGGGVGGGAQHGLPEAMLVQQLAHHPIVNATIITATRVQPGDATNVPVATFTPAAGGAAVAPSPLPVVVLGTSSFVPNAQAAASSSPVVVVTAQPAG